MIFLSWIVKYSNTLGFCCLNIPRILNAKQTDSGFFIPAIYSGDYYLFDTSDSESDSEDRETSSPDLTMSTPPQQTSEQVKDQPDGIIGEINVDIGRCISFLRNSVGWFCFF